MELIDACEFVESSEMIVYFLLQVVEGCGRKTVYLFCKQTQLFLLTDSLYSAVTMS